MSRPAQAPTGQGSNAKLIRATRQIDNAERLILALNRSYWEKYRDEIQDLAKQLHEISTRAKQLLENH